MKFISKEVMYANTICPRYITFMPAVTECSDSKFLHYVCPINPTIKYQSRDTRSLKEYNNKPNNSNNSL